MESISKGLLSIHVIAGFGSLILFWLPMFTRKGGTWHRRIGKAYVWLMWVVVSTAAFLSIENLINGQYQMAAFLGFLSVITANPLWFGISVLKNKEELSLSYRKAHLGFNIVIFLLGAALLSYGIALKGRGASILMLIFGFLGVSNIGSILKAIKTPRTQTNWFDDHLTELITTGIAAYTAFLVFGARQFLEGMITGYWSIIPWVLPTFLGVLGIRFARRYYKAERYEVVEG